MNHFRLAPAGPVFAEESPSSETAADPFFAGYPARRAAATGELRHEENPSSRDREEGPAPDLPALAEALGVRVFWVPSVLESGSPPAPYPVVRQVRAWVL